MPKGKAPNRKGLDEDTYGSEYVSPVRIEYNYFKIIKWYLKAVCECCNILFKLKIYIFRKLFWKINRLNN